MPHTYLRKGPTMWVLYMIDVSDHLFEFQIGVIWIFLHHNFCHVFQFKVHGFFSNLVEVVFLYLKIHFTISPCLNIAMSVVQSVFIFALFCEVLLGSSKLTSILFPFYVVWLFYGSEINLIFFIIIVVKIFHRFTSMGFWILWGY